MSAIWKPWANESVEVGTALSTFICNGVSRNAGRVLRYHSTSGGRSYRLLAVYPPTTEGGLGPLMFPVILRRPARPGALHVRVELVTAAEVDLRLWARIDGRLVSSDAVTVDGLAQLEVATEIGSGGSRWVVLYWGLTVDREGLPDVAVAPGDLASQPPPAVFDQTSASGLDTSLDDPAEFDLPGFGETVYIGAASAGEGVIWPPLDVTDGGIQVGGGAHPINGVALPVVGVRGVSWWSEVEPRSRLIVRHEQPPLADALPRAVAAAREAFAQAPSVSAAGFGREGLAGFRADIPNEVSPFCEAVVPVHDEVAEVRMAALLSSRRRTRRLDARWSVELLDYGTTTDAEVEIGVTSARTAFDNAFDYGVAATWGGRDGLFRGDEEELSLVQQVVEVDVTGEDHIEAALLIQTLADIHLYAFSVEAVQR